MPVFQKSMLKKFVKNYHLTYDLNNFTFNTHCLLHLTDGAKRFGPIYSYSCYKFENYLGELKSCIGSSTNILRQILNRIEGDFELQQDQNKIKEGLVKEMKLTFPDCTKSYTGYQFKNYIISGKQNDNCCYLSCGSYFQVLNFSIHKDQIKVVGKKLLDIEPYFLLPVNSLELGICTAKRISDKIEMYPIEFISFKCMTLPMPDGLLLIIPIVHTILE
jgi:hypothetical protein